MSHGRRDFLLSLLALPLAATATFSAVEVVGLVGIADGVRAKSFLTIGDVVGFGEITGRYEVVGFSGDDDVRLKRLT